VSGETEAPCGDSDAGGNAAERLAALHATLDDCPCCATVAYGYRHVPGGGCVHEPRLMLVLIHPTPRNVTAHAGWEGRRFPMAGKSRFWRILVAAGLVPPALPEELDALGPTPTAVEMLAEQARRSGLYLAHAVKCVDGGSTVPAARSLAHGWGILRREIEIVRPRAVVALGLTPFRMLTGRSVRLSDELWRARHGAYLSYPSHPVAGREYPVYPCYFPTGRGNPAAATEMLGLLRARLEGSKYVQDGP
jgi:uracil-DNA glycosylase